MSKMYVYWETPTEPAKVSNKIEDRYQLPEDYYYLDGHSKAIGILYDDGSALIELGYSDKFYKSYIWLHRKV